MVTAPLGALIHAAVRGAIPMPIARSAVPVAGVASALTAKPWRLSNQLLESARYSPNLLIADQINVAMANKIEPLDDVATALLPGP